MLVQAVPGVTMDAPVEVGPQVLKAENGDSDAQKDRGSRLFRHLKFRIQNLAPSWFSVCMGTGITSALVLDFPFQDKHHVLFYISIIIFALDVVVFLVLLVGNIIRYYAWPQIFRAVIMHPVQGLFVGTFPMALFTIINLIVLIVVPAYPTRSYYLYLAWGLWLLDVLVALACMLVIPLLLTILPHIKSPSGVTGAVLLPTTTVVVAASTGGLLAEKLPVQFAVPTIVLSYFLWGSGMFSCLVRLSIYDHRLLMHKLPPAETIVSTLFPLGPCGQGSFALLVLSQALRRAMAVDARFNAVFANSGITHISPPMAAEAIMAMSFVVVLIIMGFGTYLLLIAVLSILFTARSDGIKFNISWWGFTFPLGTYAMSLITMGKMTGDTGFRTFGAVIAAAEILLWLYVSICTTVESVKGTLFVSPCIYLDSPSRPNDLDPSITGTRPRKLS